MHRPPGWGTFSTQSAVSAGRARSTLVYFCRLFVRFAQIEKLINTLKQKAGRNVIVQIEGVKRGALGRGADAPSSRRFPQL
jgi:hypothetical protein